MNNDKYNIKQRNFDIMRNSKSQGEALYEKIMSELEPIVKTVLGEAMGVKKPMMKLNEMSDEMLNRAIVAAVDKGDFERAKKFSDYKKSEQRQENMKNNTVDNTQYNYIINYNKNSKYYVDGTIGGVQTKTYYGTFRLFTETINPVWIGELFKNINPETDLKFYINEKSANVVGSVPRSEAYKQKFIDFINRITDGLRGRKALEALSEKFKGKF